MTRKQIWIIICQFCCVYGGRGGELGGGGGGLKHKIYSFVRGGQNVFYLLCACACARARVCVCVCVRGTGSVPLLS